MTIKLWLDGKEVGLEIKTGPSDIETVDALKRAFTQFGFRQYMDGKQHWTSVYPLLSYSYDNDEWSFCSGAFYQALTAGEYNVSKIELDRYEQASRVFESLEAYCVEQLPKLLKEIRDIGKAIRKEKTIVIE